MDENGSCGRPMERETRLLPVGHGTIIETVSSKAIELRDLAVGVKNGKKDDSYGQVRAFIIGSNALNLGLEFTADILRQNWNELGVIIYRLGGTDAPDRARAFAKIAEKAGIDAVIFYPFAGRSCLMEWAKALQDKGMHPVAGCMHKVHDPFFDDGYPIEFIQSNFIDLAISLNVRDFIVPPGIESIRRIRRLLTERLGAANGAFTLYIDRPDRELLHDLRSNSAAGHDWHAIIKENGR